MSEENKPEETTVPTPPVGEDGKEEGKAGSAADGSAEHKTGSSESVGAESPPVENKPEGSTESKTEASVPPAGASTPAATDAAAERAAARAARLAARAATEAGEPAPAGAATPAGADAGSDEEKAAKAQAAAEARAARAAARGAKPESADPAAPKEPSPNQPLLDRLVAILKAEAGEDAVVESFINQRDAHRPYVIIHSSRWPQAALTLRNHEELRCDYLRNLSGVDQETHLEVAYHLLSLTHKHEYCVKVKTDREQPSIPSVADVWPTANWNEREAFDLFGIDFPGHPNLVRIMMPDDWVGHPLRKDYEPLDPEV
jgi:NADH-quinone oxidoreductase subunit C